MVVVAERLAVLSFDELTRASYDFRAPTKRFTIPSRHFPEFTETSYVEPFSRNPKSELLVQYIAESTEEGPLKTFELGFNDSERILHLTPPDTRKAKNISGIGTYEEFTNELIERHRPPQKTKFEERFDNYHDGNIDMLAVNWPLISQLLNPEGSRKFEPVCFREVSLHNGSDGGIPDLVGIDGSGRVYIADVGMRLNEDGEMKHYKDGNLRGYGEHFMEVMGNKYGIVPVLLTIYVHKTPEGHILWAQQPQEPVELKIAS